ncbi:hypothetical protein C8F04DRAFT_362523 [Mycena alexandri]|uniref:RNB domain-containing protein n=1 Tax=Mycena alexandri TaxID=1745969 RepID=A0AAD6S1K2_9AGAR|nr:hypothetical protein C8F04DRAFT_362523 [Mycena alexandri]
MHRVALARAVRIKCARSFSVSCIRHNRTISPAEYGAMTELTEKIVDIAAKQEPPEGWAHTPDLMGTEKRLGSAIQTVDSFRLPSMEKRVFDLAVNTASVSVDNWAEEEGSSEASFAPGTFIEVRRNNVSSHGVVLGEVIQESRVHIISLMTGGDVWDPLREDVMFSVPSLVPPDLARRCSMEEIATDDIQLNARIKVLQHTRQVERAVEAATADLVRKGIDVYSLVKSHDPDNWATTTVAEVARLFNRNPTLVSIFATHKYLMDKSEYFVSDHAYLLNQTFDVRPASHIETIRRVAEWSRQRDGPIQDFAKRAIPIISAQRKLHSETRADTPSQRPAQHTWTPEDITILKFLHQSLQPKRTIQMDPYSIGQSAILRTLNPGQEVDDHEIHMALVDLSVYAPWQDIYSLRRTLNLDLEDPKTSAKAQATDALVQRSLSKPPAAGVPLGPEDFYVSDPLDHLRHDFGNMPIYVIDDSSAQERDDGVSVEAVPGEPDSYWIHVHIADPASVIPPTHILAQRAEKQSQTVYFMHRTWPLFPKSLMFSGRRGFSLSNQVSNNVLTFSSKINPAGDLVESIIRPGIARNIVQLTYDAVDLALLGKTITRFYPFSPPPPPPTLKHNFPEQHLADLRTLLMLRTRLVKNRSNKGVIEPNVESASIEDYTPPQNIESPTMQPSEFRGFPEFSYWTSSIDQITSGARGLVGEAMKVACRTASLWCVRHDVDIIRRTATPLAATPENLEQLRALRDKDGYVDVAFITALASSMPLADYSVTPDSHWSLGVADGEGYARATSPLRRFCDLIGHYQIHRALLKEKSYFSSAYLADYIKWLKRDDVLKKRTENLHDRFWALIALRRWLEAPRTDIPDPLENLQAIVMRLPRLNSVTNTLQSEVRIPALAISASLVGITVKQAQNWRIAASMPVEIDRIQLGVRPSLFVRNQKVS